MTQRMFYGFLAGAILTPVAGYLALLAMPGIGFFWIVTTLVSIISGPMFFYSLLAPAALGAWYAWPLTCLILPLASLVFAQRSARTPLIFLPVGAGGGVISLYIIGAIYPGSVFTPRDLFVGALVSGALLGAFFGFMLCRIERIKPRSIAQGAHEA